MKITTKQVVHKYLELFLEQITEDKITEIHLHFMDFFTKEELVDIIEYMDVYPSRDIPNQMSYQELLYEIGDDGWILGYFLHQWNIQDQRCEKIHPHEIQSTLKQLALHGHYLSHKNPKDWDGYDFSNYRSLQLKAGKLKIVYGIYDTMVKPTEVYTVDSQPKRFFETYNKAQKALEEYTNCGIFKKKEVHILQRYIAT